MDGELPGNASSRFAARGTVIRSVLTPRGRRVAALVALLGAATAAGAYLQGALSVLSSHIIAEFGVTRSQLGLTFTVFSITGGLASPLVGRLSDIWTRRMLAALFVVAATGLLMAAAAPALPWVLVATVVGGLGLAIGNPVTNKIVSQQVSAQRRGLAIGVKQAGPPLALFAAGLLLPPLVSAFGWRTALALSASIPLAGLVGTRLLVPPDWRRSDDTSAPLQSTAEVQAGRHTVGYLAVIGMLVGMGGAGIIAFLPLYAQESVGLSPVVAGLVAAVMGVTGVVARVLWAVVADRFVHPTRPLTALSIVAFAATIALWAGSAAPWLLWLGALGTGASMMAWHAVAWLALVNAVHADGIGKATGLVQLGNGFGFGVGPPLFGMIVDASGYGPGWAFVAACFALSTILTLLWRRAIP